VSLTFSDLPLRPETIAALNQHGFVAPFPIQEQVLPLALADGDVIGQAKTGTGKTLAFGIPLIERVIAPHDHEWETLSHQGKPQALVVVPTRELCIQVTKDLMELSTNRGIRTLAVYGGKAFEPQIDALQQGQLHLKFVSRVVLDEADEMLDLGFLPDVEKIFTSTPARVQTMLFSATMPGDIIALARRFMNQPVHIRASNLEDEGAVVSRIEQHVIRAHAMDKTELLARILQAENRGPTIVFCRTKRTAQKTSDDLVERGFRAASIHGDLGQTARERALNDFKGGKSDVLIATDVAARGIDIDGITHVINYQCPEDEKTYVHRIGRTARAGAHGIAVTFVDWDELARWKMIDSALSLGLPEPIETYSSSDHLYEMLNIPRDAQGRMSKVKKERTEKAGSHAQAPAKKRERVRTKRIATEQ
jgi:superfamily II DNA/RNA helicase